MLKSQSFIMKIPWPPFMHYKKVMLFLLSVLVFLPAVHLQDPQIQKNEFSALENEAECPKMIPQYFANMQPSGGFDEKLISYSKKEAPQTKEECVQLCCIAQNCNIVFMYLNNTQLICYHATCLKDENCVPVVPNKTNVANKLKNKSLMVLVRPNGEEWKPFQEQKKAKVCEVGLEECGENQVCQAAGSKSRSGVCQCLKGKDFSRAKRAERLYSGGQLTSYPYVVIYEAPQTLTL